MKSLIFLIALLFGFVFTAISQVEVPAVVTDGFTKKFPTATKVKWEKENDTEFEAAFKMDGKSMTACFDDKGNWVETEWEVKVKKLPEAVVTAVTDKYPGFKIDVAEYCETPDFTGYEMEIEKSEGKEEVEKEIQVSKDGKSIKELTEETDEESEE